MSREFAKYAHEHDCYVLTSDSDAIICSIRGVIPLDEVYSSFRRHSLKYIPIVRHDRLLEVCQLNDAQLRYLALLLGNDFVKGIHPAYTRGLRDQMLVEGFIQHIIPLQTEEEMMDDYHNHSHLPVDEVRWRFEMVKRKYDVNSYPSFPLSFLTEEEDEGVYDECGVTRGLGVSLCCDIDSLTDFITSYGAHYSHFLLDYMLVPRLSIPITFFFENDERSVE